MVRNEAAQIVAVTSDSENFSRYHFYLSDFPRKDILGLSIGKRRIYISYNLAKLAMKTPRYWWLLRQTLAHEIAHELAEMGFILYATGGTAAALKAADVPVKKLFKLSEGRPNALDMR